LKKKLTYIFLAISVWSFGQRNKITSLEKELSVATADSTKIDLSISIITSPFFTNLDSSVYYFDQAMELALKNQDSQRIINLQTTIINKLIYNGHYHKAKAYLDEALELGHQRNDDRMICRTLVTLGGWHWELSNTAECLKTLQQALIYAKKTNATRYKAMVLFSFGLFYGDIDDSENQQKSYLQALELYTETKDTLNQAITLTNLADICVEEKKYKTALEYIDQVSSLLESVDHTDYSIYEFTLFLKSKSLYYLGEKKLGCSILKSVIKIAEKTHNYRAIIIFYDTKAKWLLEAKKYDEAIHFSKIAFKKSSEIDYIQELPGICETLIKAYKAKGDYQLSLFWAEEKRKVIDEEKKRSNNQEAIKLEAKYKLKEKEMENQALALKNKNQKIIASLLLTSTFFISFIIFYFFRKKQEKELNQFRQQVSNDLHDEVGSDLNSIIRIAKGFQTIEDKIEIQNIATDLIKKTNNAIHNIVDVIWTIDNNESYLNDLIQKMEDHLDVIKKTNPNIKIHFAKNNLNQQKILPINFKHHLFMIFKEAINNIQKHTDSSNIDITLENVNQKFQMNISNHFSTKKNNANSTGRGICNIKERTKELGGNVIINQSKNQFTINIQLRRQL